jgi:hypothetical protein
VLSSRRRRTLQSVFSEWKAVTKAAANGLASLLLDGFGESSHRNVVRMRRGTAPVTGLQPLLAGNRSHHHQFQDAIIQYVDGRVAAHHHPRSHVAASAHVSVPLLQEDGPNDSTLVGVVLAGLQASRYQALTTSALASLISASHAAERGSMFVGPAPKGGSIVVDWAGGFEAVSASPVPHAPSSAHPRSPQWSPSSPSDTKLTASQLDASVASSERPAIAFPVPVTSLGPEWAHRRRDEYVWVTQREDGTVEIVPPPPQQQESRHVHAHPAVASKAIGRPPSPATTRSFGRGSRRSTSASRYREEHRAPAPAHSAMEAPPVVSAVLSLSQGGMALPARFGGTIAVIFTESSRIRALGCFYRVFSRFSSRLAA